MSRKKATGVTRNEILDVAWDLISEQGAEVSMQDIAKAANVSRQSVYLHFKSRGGLLMGLVKRADDRFAIREEFFAAMKIASPDKRLDACLGAWFKFAKNIQPVANDLIRLRKTDADAAAAWEDRMTELRLWEKKLVESLAADSALKEGWTVASATDFLWASSSIQICDLLTGDRGWSARKCSQVLRSTIANALLRE